MIPITLEQLGRYVYDDDYHQKERELEIAKIQDDKKNIKELEKWIEEYKPEFIWYKW